jgi:hypothetical protein
MGVIREVRGEKLEVRKNTERGRALFTSHL